MPTTTISKKFQIVIPKEVRRQLRLHSGQRLAFIVKGGVAHLVPEEPLASFRGRWPEIETAGLREEADRL